MRSAASERAGLPAVAAVPTVPLAAASAWVLRGQGLAGSREDADVPAAVGAAAGVYATAPTCYLSCAARLGGFRREVFDAAVQPSGHWR